MPETKKKNQAGFSLIELVIALAATLVVMSIAVTLLARTLNIRTRENEHVDELGDVQRALNIMSREIANSGFNLVTNNGSDSNGIVAADSNSQSIRIRANLNKFATSGSINDEAKRDIGDPLATPGAEAGEDVTYYVNVADNTKYLARWDRFATALGTGTVLANRVDTIGFYYFDQKVTYTQDPDNCQITNKLDEAGAALDEVTPDNAKYVVIAVCIHTPEVGTRGSPGFQPEFRTLLISDVTLRNSRLNRY